MLAFRFLQANTIHLLFRSTIGRFASIQLLVRLRVNVAAQNILRLLLPLRSGCALPRLQSIGGTAGVPLRKLR